jgi:outer membrane protein
MIRKFILVSALALAGIFSIHAQRIAVVDVNDVLAEMPAYQEAQGQLDKLAAQWRQEIAQEYDKIKSMYNKYQAEQVLLSEDARMQREEEIMEKEKIVREIQKEKFGPEGSLFKRRQELVQPIQDKVYGAIESYAGDRGYDFIFDKGGSAGLLFATDEYDKTDDIKKRLGIN